MYLLAERTYIVGIGFVELVDAGQYEPAFQAAKPIDRIIPAKALGQRQFRLLPSNCFSNGMRSYSLQRELDTNLAEVGRRGAFGRLVGGCLDVEKGTQTEILEGVGVLPDSFRW